MFFFCKFQNESTKRTRWAGDPGHPRQWPRKCCSCPTWWSNDASVGHWAEDSGPHRECPRILCSWTYLEEGPSGEEQIEDALDDPSFTWAVDTCWSCHIVWDSLMPVPYWVWTLPTQPGHWRLQDNADKPAFPTITKQGTPSSLWGTKYLSFPFWTNLWKESTQHATSSKSWLSSTSSARSKRMWVTSGASWILYGLTHHTFEKALHSQDFVYWVHMSDLRSIVVSLCSQIEQAVRFKYILDVCNPRNYFIQEPHWDVATVGHAYSLCGHR